jgi:hypothetical protein
MNLCKKSNVILFLVIVVLLVGVLISFSNKAFTERLTGQLQKEDFIFDLPKGIELGVEFTNSLKAKLNKPLKVREYDAEGHYKTYYYKGFEIVTTFSMENKEYIDIYTIKGKGIKTKRGLMVGDSKDTMVKKYGEWVDMDDSVKDSVDYIYEFKVDSKNGIDYYNRIGITVFKGIVESISFVSPL